MTNEQEERFLFKQYCASEQMKNNAMLIGSLVNSVLFTMLSSAFRHTGWPCDFFRGSVFCYMVAFIFLLYSHFEATMAIEGLLLRCSEEDGRKEKEKVMNLNSTIFMFILFGVFCSLIGLYLLTT